MRQGLVFSIIMMGMVCGCALAAGGTLPGTGTEADPYLIEDVNDFDAFANPANAATYWAAGVHTKLMTNIDLSGRTYTTAVIAPDTDDQNEGFQGALFTGVFDGNDFTVNNLTIYSAVMDYANLGLFGWISASGGEVKNLNIDNIAITIVSESHRIGGLAGQNDGGVISCHMSGSVRGYNAVGGLVGANLGYITNSSSKSDVIGTQDSIGGLVGYNSPTGNVTNCYSTNTVSGIQNVGGLVGFNHYGNVNNSHSNGNISGVHYAGGLIGKNIGGINPIGQNPGGVITKCYSTCNASGDRYIGGLVGMNERGNITNCYSTGNVNGGGVVGGLVGYNTSEHDQYSATITNCYSIGSVDGDEYIGGLVGFDYIGTLSKNYWDIETSETTDGVGDEDPDPAGVTGKTTTEMMTQSTFTGWDFMNDWMMLRESEDYPRLAWQETFMGDIAGLYGVDMVDFAWLASWWNEPVCDDSNQWCQGADIDGSGDVGISDLAYIAQDWLK
ncbi:MAG: hypothetical protein OEV87_05430 [Phycisphaerae bacterium]|nr:hypothetical protein [Phycisphaerae bacterium]